VLLEAQGHCWKVSGALQLLVFAVISPYFSSMSQPNAIAINITLDSQNYQERIVSMNTAFRGFGRASHKTNDQMIRPQIRQIVLMLQKSSRGLTKYC